MNMYHPRIQPVFPLLPEPAASTRCVACTWCWHEGQMRLKVINRCCAVHARYLEPL